MVQMNENKPEADVRKVPLTTGIGTSRIRSTVSSVELFRGGSELLIEHNGETYSLRLTSKGRLILTK